MQGYRLGDAQMQFQITVQIDVSNTISNSSQSISLSPSTPSVVSSIGNVSATLLGDLANYQASPNFGYSMLMIPTPAGICLDTFYLAFTYLLGSARPPV